MAKGFCVWVWYVSMFLCGFPVSAVTTRRCTRSCRTDVLGPAAFPAEDGEVRVSSRTRVRGGNASNTAVVTAQLNGGNVSWMGTCADPAVCT